MCTVTASARCRWHRFQPCENIGDPIDSERCPLPLPFLRLWLMRKTLRHPGIDDIRSLAFVPSPIGGNTSDIPRVSVVAFRSCSVVAGRL